MQKPDPAKLAQQLQQQHPVPYQHPQLTTWNPPLSGDIAIRIDSGGVWHHDGSVIQREALVKLFASILRRESDGDYYLVTPVEKWRIQVDDAPFLAVTLEVGEPASEDHQNQTLRFTTNLGEAVIAGPEHPLEVDYGNRADQDEPRPYIYVRPGLRALLTRAVFWQLAELAEELSSSNDGQPGYGVWSGGQLFRI